MIFSVRSIILASVFSLAWGAGSAFAAPCGPATQAKLAASMREYVRSARKAKLPMDQAPALGCKVLATSLINGSYNPYLNQILVEVPQEKFGMNELHGALAHEFGHSIWQGFIQRLPSKAMAKLVEADRLVFEKKIFEHYDEVYERYLDEKNETRKNNLALKLNSMSEAFPKFDSPAEEIFYAADELAADILAVYLTQDLKANQVVSSPYRDFGYEVSPRHWPESAEKKYKESAMRSHNLLAPLHYPLGKMLIGVLPTRFRELLEALSKWTAQRVDLLANGATVNWEKENLSGLEMLEDFRNRR